MSALSRFISKSIPLFSKVFLMFIISLEFDFKSLGFIGFCEFVASAIVLKKAREVSSSVDSLLLIILQGMKNSLLLLPLYSPINVEVCPPFTIEKSLTLTVLPSISNCLQAIVNPLFKNQKFSIFV